MLFHPVPFSSGAACKRGRCAGSARRQCAAVVAPRRWVAAQAAAAAAQQDAPVLTMADALAKAAAIKELRDSLPGLKAELVEAQRMAGDVGERVALLAGRDIKDGQVRWRAALRPCALVGGVRGGGKGGAAPHELVRRMHTAPACCPAHLHVHAIRCCECKLPDAMWRIRCRTTQHACLLGGDVAA